MDERSIFVDDGISGAEFANRPGYVRLLNALKPKPRFQMLIVSVGRVINVATASAQTQLCTDM